MRIKKVRVSNYRSIKDTIEIDFSQLTAFIGPNNSGKSNILWCINKILGNENSTADIFTEKDVYQQDPKRDIDVEIEFDEPFVYEPFEGEEPARIDKIRCVYKLHRDGPYKGKRYLEKHCLTKDNRIVQVLAEKPGVGSTQLFKTLSCPLEKIREKIPVVYIRTDRITTQSRSDIRLTLMNSLLEEINKDFLRKDNTISIMNSDGTETQVPRKQWFDQCIEEAMITLRTEAFTRLKDTIRQSMLDYLGYETVKDEDETLWDIYFKPITSRDFYQSMEMCLYEENRITPLRALGEGVQNAIILSILNAYNQEKSHGFILMLEEPEMYLHPRMKRNLYRVLRSLSEKNQVIYITHSTNFVFLSDFDSVRMVTNDGNGTRVQGPVCDKADQLKENFKNIMSTELNEIFFTKKVLLVENELQKKKLLDYQVRFGLDYDLLGVAILYVGNKSDMLDFVELGLAFGIEVAVAFEMKSAFYADIREEEAELNSRLMAGRERGISVFCAAGDPDIPVPGFIQSLIDWITKTGRS